MPTPNLPAGADVPTDAEPARPGTPPVPTGAVRDAIRGTVAPEKPQGWIDRDREWNYTLLGNELRDADAAPGGIRGWVTDLFGDLVRGTRGTPLEPGELSSLRLVFLESRTASRIAGEPVVRPVLQFTDIGQYQAFRAAIQRGGSLASRGLAIGLQDRTSLLFASGELDDRPDGEPDAVTGAIRPLGARTVMEHEIRHSIDPHLGARAGYHRLLDEAFAYYDQEIEHPVGHATEDARWRMYAATVGQAGEYRRCSDGVADPITQDEYEALCRDAVTAIRTLHGSVGHLEAQRRILQCWTLGQLFTMAGVAQPAILARI